MIPTTQTKLQTVKVKDIVTPPDDLSDEDIVKQIKTGNINAYGSIMRRYNQRIFRIARSIVTDDATAMDIVQETHIKAYTRIEQFHGSSSFISWLARITRNEALMYLRKHKREVSMPDNEMDFLEKFKSDSLPIKHNELPDTFLENKQLEKLINQYLDILPTNFRSVFVLRAVEQFSVKETADILDIKEETVKTRFFRARGLLREQLQAYLDTVGMTIYEFGADHCDMIVRNVMNFIYKNKK